MQKLSVRYGLIFSCGWLLPTEDMQSEFITAFGASANGSAEFALHKFPAIVAAVGGNVVEPTGACVCAGISEMFSVWVCSPPIAPRAIPSPTCTGTRPCKLGSPK